MDLFTEIYNKLLVTQDTSDFLSPQTLIANFYIIALLISMYKAKKRREQLTNFIAITSVCVQYMLCAGLMQISINYALSGGNIGIAQFAYIGLVIIAILSFYIAYKAHLRYAFGFGQLFIVSNKLIALMCLGHIVIWVKLAVFKIYDVLWLDVFYSTYVLALSFVLAVIMLAPKFLNSRLGKIATLSFKKTGE